MTNIKTPKSIDENPQPLEDEKGNRTTLSVGQKSIVVDGEIYVNLAKGEHNTNQFVVVDGGQLKTRTGAEVLSDIGDEGGDIQQVSFTSANDFSSQTVSSGAADFATQGSNGVTTSVGAGPTITISGTNASTAGKGVVELATTAETTTGTDTARAVTPDGLKDGYQGSANVDTVGTIGTGTWEGTAIANDYVADLPTSKIASGTMADARIAASNVTQHQGSITGTGALDSGSITSGFGDIDNGTNTFNTGVATMDKITVAADALTTSSSDDNLLFLRQQLNAGSGQNSGMVIENYSMFKTMLTDTDSAGWDNVYHINCLTGATRQFSVDKDGKVTTGGNLTVGDNLYLADDKKLYLGAEADNDYIYSDGSQINLALDDSDIIQFRDVQLRSEVPILIQEAASATVDVAGKGQLWVKNDTPNNLYFTNDAGNDVQITNGSSLAGGSGGTSRWAHSCGGYKNNNNTTNYYFQYYPNRYFWGNAESSPTSISYTDLYAAEWQAPVAGTLTKIDAMVRASGATDDCTFYVYKASPSVGGNGTTSLTLIGDSGSCGIDSTSQTFYKSAAISSSNTFSAGDLLFVMFKKDSTSASTQHTFTVTISGEYS